MRNRIFAVLLSVVLILAFSISAGAVAPATTEIKLVPDKTTAAPGDTITYSLILGPVGELGSLQMTLSVPSGATYVSGSFSLVSGIKQSIGFDYLDWTESSKLLNGVASTDYQSSSDTKLATFKCKIDSSFTGTLQPTFTNLEFASSNPPAITTSRFKVASTAVTVKKPQTRINFPDVNYNAWYGDAVEYAVAAGLMKGYSNGKFGTTDNIQRQDFVVILSRLSGDKIEDYTNMPNFKDVSKGMYYTAPLAWAKATGVSSGYTSGSDKGKFGVGRKITREQIMTFLYNYAKNIRHDDVSVSDSEKNSIAANYPDFAKVSAFAKDATYWSLSRGVISGKVISGKKYISPQVYAQRCEVAQMFYNINKNSIFG